MRLSSFILFILTLFTFQAKSQEIEVITQERILGVITIISYSPDGSLIASGSGKENSVKIWDVNSGKIIGKLEGHEGATTALCFNHDGTKLYSSAKDERLIRWDLVNWELEDSANVGTALTSMVAFDNAFYAGGKNGHVLKFDPNNLATSEKLYSQELPITKVDVFENTLVSGTSGGRVTVFNLETKEEERSKKLHFSRIRGLRFIDNGTRLITTGGAGTVHLWDVKDFDNNKHIQASAHPIVAFDANDKKRFFVVASENKEIKVYDFDGNLLHDYKTKKDGYDETRPIDAISISPDGSTVASTGFRRFKSRKKQMNDNVIRVWDVNRGALMHTLQGTVNPIFTFAFHPTENKLATLGEDRVVTLWDLDVAEKSAQFTLVVPQREKAPKRKTNKGKKAMNVANKWLNGGNVVGDAIENTKKRTKDAAVEKMKRSFKERTLIQYSHSGKYLVTKLPKDEIRKYDLTGLEPEHKGPVWSYQRIVNEVAFSPDDQFMMVLGAGDSAVSVIDMQKEEFVQKLSTPLPQGNLQYLYEARSGAFSPDGQYFAVCFNNSKTYVYETTNWRMVFESKLDGDISYARGTFVNFTEDGKYMVVNTPIGAMKYETGSFSTYNSKPLNVKGFSVPIDRPFDYAITVSKKKLYFEEIISGTVVESINVRPNEITHISVSKNGKVGMTLKTGQFFLFNPKTGEEEVQFVGEGENYIFKTSDNYYKVSKEGFDLVTFRIGNKAYPFEQFDAVYNRPDIVLERLGCEDQDLISAYKRAYEKRIKKLGLTPTNSVSLRDIPTAKVENLAEIPAVTEKESVLANVKFSDNVGLSSYNIYINNVPLYGKKGKSLEGKKSAEFSEEIFLVYGTNKIQVSARNNNGLESLMQTFYIDKTGEEPKPNLLLVTIGTSKYKDQNYNLAYAVKDAEDLTKILSTNTKGVYNEVKSKSLYNEEVTVENIAELKSFLETSKPDDIVMLFVAGHGVLDADFDYYFGTHDIDFLNPKARGLAYEKLEGLLDGIKANKKILIMDTCHSGEVDKDEVIEAEVIEEDDGDIDFRAAGINIASKKGSGASASKLAEELFNDLRRGTGSTVISSAGGAEFAMESDEWKNGLFTYCLLNGLKNYTADLDKDGQIMLSELQEYVVIKVAGLSHGRQVPNTRMQNIELDFRIW